MMLAGTFSQADYDDITEIKTLYTRLTCAIGAQDLDEHWEDWDGILARLRALMVTHADLLSDGLCRLDLAGYEGAPCAVLLTEAQNAICALTGLSDWRRVVMQEAPYPEAPYGALARAILGCLPTDEAEVIRREFEEWRRETFGEGEIAR